MINVEGKCGIYAKILADSSNSLGDRMVTYELQYPRIVHAELLTHGMLRRNSASSRAIPFAKMREQLTAVPVRFGGAQKGMQDAGEHKTLIQGYTAEEWWDLAKKSALRFSEEFYEAGYAKQIFNRTTEAFQMMKVVLSGTEYDNFFWLRNDGAADPTLHELARVMLEARNASTPMLLQPGQWHLPYVDWLVRDDGSVYWKDEFGTFVRSDWQTLVKVSAARCAAVSFRNEDYGLERCLEVHARLVGDARKHASAFEHQCTPMETERRQWSEAAGPVVNQPAFPSTWEDGISHMDRKGNLWSGPLKGFIQYRKLIPGENYEGEI